MATFGESELQFDKDMASPHRELFESARAFLLSYDGVTETKKPRITTYGTLYGGICHMRTMPNGIDIGFLKGVRLNDRFEALKGKGKTMRVLSLEKMDICLVQYYLEQAIHVMHLEK